MALIVEDGTIIAGANTYVDDSEYQAYANQRQKTIGADATAREAELILAMDYIESFRNQFKGTKVSATQPLQWPRQGVYIDGAPFPSGEIPTDLKKAQMEAAISVASDVNLQPSSNRQNVESESIGDLSVSYFYGGSWENVQLENVDAALNELLKNNGNCNILTRV